MEPRRTSRRGRETPAAVLFLIGATCDLVPAFAADAAPAWPAAPLADGMTLKIEGGIVSDYVYRGVTLSDRKPSPYGEIEAAFGAFYTRVGIQTVRLPSEPAGEVTFRAGYKWKIPDAVLDFNVTYFSYPAEAIPGPGINYWELAALAEKEFGPLTLKGEYAFSPSFANTGAWGQYAQTEIAYELAESLLPRGIGGSLSGALGYSWFGNQSGAFGGFPLPSYFNWSAGVSFTYDKFTLDLRYHDTNLSREDCFVYTGDLGAALGGRANPLTNLDGRMSRWCGAAFVGKLSFELDSASSAR